MGRSLTIRPVLAGPAPVPVVRVGPAVGTVPAVLVDLVGRVAVPVDPAHMARVDLVAGVVLGPVDLVALADLVAPGERMGRVDLVARAVPVARVVPVSPVARVVPVEVTGRADLVSPEVRERVRTDPVARVSLVDLLAPVVLVVLVVRVSRVVPADPGGTDLVGPVVRRHLRTCSTVTTTGVARSGVVLATHRTASARRTMVRRHHHPHTDSVGTVDPLPERRHPTGTARRLRVAGTDRHPLGAGTSDGMGRRAT